MQMTTWLFLDLESGLQLAVGTREDLRSDSRANDKIASKCKALNGHGNARGISEGGSGNGVQLLLPLKYGLIAKAFEKGKSLFSECLIVRQWQN